MRQSQDFTLSEKTFRVQKFTPEVACFWHARLMGDLLTSAESNLSVENIPKDKTSIIKAIVKMVGNVLKVDRALYKDLQRDALAVVTIQYQAGHFPVVDGAGNFLEDITSPDYQTLTLRSFVYSMSDFFGPAVLKDMLAGVKEALPSSFLEQLTNLADDSSTSPSSKDTGNSANSGTEPTPSPIS